MKNNIRYTILLIFILAAGCRKADMPGFPDVAKVPVPVITKDTTGDLIISALNPAAFNGKINLDVYFKNDLPKKMDVEVAKNGNTAGHKTLQADVTTFPATITVTGPQLEALFGEPIAIGDYFDISPDITTLKGETFPAFPLVGQPYAGNMQNMPNVSFVIRYTSVCQYDPEIFKGNFIVVLDEWADYAPGDTVAITKIDNSHFSFQYLAFDARPIIVSVNPATNETTVVKQVYGNYMDGEGDYSIQTAAGNVDNFVAPCEGKISLALIHSVARGSTRPFKIVLRKA